MKYKTLRGMAARAKAICLAAVMTFSFCAPTMPVAAEEYYEEEEEEEYIPETYYEPVQTNDLSGWPQGQPIQAAAGIVMDLDTNAIIYGKNIYEKQYPASITKIMTTLVALEHTEDLDERFVCGEEVYDIEENSSNLGIQPGEELTMRQALYGLMLESANDLGNAIAMHIAGSISGYADLMNEKASALGCVNTHFTNPHGLHSEEHYTCAYDMALIAKAAYRRKAFRKICSTTEYTIPATNIVEEDRSFANHQRLLQSYSDYYQPWCTGGKTGFTSDAWNTLVTYAEKDGKRLVCVILRENGLDNSYLETTDLINYAFNNFEHVEVTGASKDLTFSDLLKLNYPNAGTTVYTSDLLQQKTILEEKPGVVTVPVGTDVTTLGRTSLGDKKGTFVYTYDGWEVGSGAISFAPLPTGITLAYQQERNMEELLEKSKSGRQLRELQQTAKTAWNNITVTSVDLYDQASDYVAANRMTVLLAGLLITAVLILLIIILILRCTRESRRARRRKAEERQIRKAEEEIERKSAIEIEEELRQAMAEERKKREEEERIKEQQRIEEEKLLEAERFLEQIRNEHND